MVRFTLEIQMGNDAVQTEEDIAELLTRAALRVVRGGVGGAAAIMDANGNRVGRFYFSTEPDEYLREEAS